MRRLQAEGSFVYDDITWRLIAKDETTLRVRADIDGTEMTIALPSSFALNAPLPEGDSKRLRDGNSQSSSLPSLPFVLEMHNNPLGIDWTLTLKPTAQQ